MIEQLNQIHNQLVSEGHTVAAEHIAQAISVLSYGDESSADSSGGTGGGDPDGGNL